MDNGEGMSFAEFTYPLLQGWDFWHLYNKLGVQCQIGGSDQFGNIITGIDVVKTVRSTEEAPHFQMPSGAIDNPFGLTVPILTDSSGAKFGKSAGNAIWLDAFKTSPFDLYGYFMKRPDDDVEKLLKLFTFLKTTDIAALMEKQVQDPVKRVAHHALAFEVLSLVHGTDVAIRTQQQHQFMFAKSQGIEMPNPDLKYDPVEAQTTLNNAPRMDMQLPRSVVMETSPANIVFAAGFATSRTQAHKLVNMGGAYVAGYSSVQAKSLIPGNLDWTPMKLWFPGEAKKWVIDDRIIILRKGKTNVRIIELVSDEHYAASGQTYPGQPYTGKTRLAIMSIIEEAKKAGVEVTAKEVRQKLAEAGRERHRINLDETAIGDVVRDWSVQNGMEPAEGKAQYWEAEKQRIRGLREGKGKGNLKDRLKGPSWEN